MSEPRQHLIIGCGYVGLALARHLAATGDVVVGTSRSDLRRSEIENVGARFAQFDFDTADALPSGRFDSISILTPPGADPAQAIERVRSVVDKAKSATVAVLVGCELFGSTRGTVTERTHPAAHSEAERRWAAMDAAALLLREEGKPVAVVRSAEVYGPGRDYRAKALTHGAFVIRPSPATSRIHVDDLAALLAAVNRPGGPPVLLACDELPSAEYRVVGEAARLLGLPPPRELSPEQAGAESSAHHVQQMLIGHSCRSIVRPWLGVRLRYPTYREGLRACLL